MRWGIISLFSLLCVGLVLPGGYAAEPQWALLSTEVDETIDGPLYKDRQMLTLRPPSWAWSGLASDIFFDPGLVLGVETGLDAFDIQTLDVTEHYYFSTEVDFEYEGVAYEDEDLLQYDPVSGLVSQALDIKDVMGADYGLDAALWWYTEERDQIVNPNNAGFWQLVFSTEVGGEAWIEDGWVEFTDGDILLTDGVDLTGYLDLQEIFGRNVGLDALDGWVEQGENEQSLIILLSTEVDGIFELPDAPVAAPIASFAFKDQDLIQLSFAMLPDGEVTGLTGAELAWRGIEDGFGKDVGLDAVCIGPMIPEPGTMLLVGLGLGALVLRLRRKR